MKINSKYISPSFLPQQLDEMRVRVRVSDVDDNSPSFALPPGPGANMTAGVRVNAPLYTAVARVRASDPDRGGSGPVHYRVHNVTYYRDRSGAWEILDEGAAFAVDAESGLIQVRYYFGLRLKFAEFSLRFKKKFMVTQI